MEYWELYGMNIQSILCAIIPAGLLAIFYFQYILSKDNLPQGPWGFPVIGHLPLLGKYPHLTLTKMSRKYGPVFRVKMSDRPTVVLCGYDVIREALVEKGQAFAGRPDFESFKYITEGKNLAFQTYSPSWKLLRRTAVSILHIFTTTRQATTDEIIIEQAQRLVEDLTQVANEPIDPQPYITGAASNVILSLCFGANIDRGENRFVKAHLRSNESYFQAIGANSGDLITWAEPFTRIKLKHFKALMKDQLDSLKPLMEAHQETFQETHERDAMDACITAAKKLPKAEKTAVGLTEEEILLIPAGLVGAGTGSVATALHWAVLYMACFPEVQKRAREEIHELIGTERYVSSADRGKLSYTEACILEILRHSSVSHLSIAHSTLYDIHLRGYKIPKDTMVIINHWSVNHNESVWESPEVFRPERFLLKDELAVDKAKAGQFWPFSLGKRRCIGQKLAQSELSLFFVTLLQRCKFVISADHPISLEPRLGLLLQPQKYKLIIQPFELHK